MNYSITDKSIVFALKLVLSIALLSAIACSPQKSEDAKEIKEVKVEFVDKLVLKSSLKRNNDNIEKYGTCGPQRKLVDIVYNDGLWAIYFDEQDQSIVYYNIDNEEEERIELGDYIKDNELESIEDMFVYEFDKLLFLTKKGFFTMVGGEVTNSALHSEINDEYDLDLFYFNEQNIFSTKKRIINDSILITFNGLCGVIDTVNKLNCEFIALMGFNTLRSKMLPVKISDYFGVDTNRKLISDFYSISEIDNVPYIRFKNDSVLMNVYNVGDNESAIHTKGIDAEKDFAFIEQLESLDLPEAFIDFWREALKAKWSQFFKMEKEKVYFTVCITTKGVTESLTVKNNIMPVYETKVDFYDENFNFINDVELADTAIFRRRVHYISELNYLLVSVLKESKQNDNVLDNRDVFSAYNIYKLSVEYEE